MAARPTLRLPRITSISGCSVTEIQESLQYLRRLYTPKVRGSRRVRNQVLTDDVVSSKFEHSYSLRWLTALISQAEVWEDERSTLLEDAAAVLAACSGTAGAGTLHRTFTYSDIDVQIRDIPLDNQDYSSLGNQTWGGACVLSETIIENPSIFGLPPLHPFRVLELGAGTGLVSLAIKKLCDRLPNSKGTMTIVATDFYLPVLQNLEHNIAINFPDKNRSSSISSSRLDWSTFPESPIIPPFTEPFDLVLGADIIYEAEHALWINKCLAILLRKPSNTETRFIPTFHLMIPLRSTHTSESSTVEAVFPRQYDGPDQPALQIVQVDRIICEADQESGDSNTIDYVHYQIRWSS